MRQLILKFLSNISKPATWGDLATLGNQADKDIPISKVTDLQTTLDTVADTLLASGYVDCNATGDTVLIFEGGKGLNNHFPAFMKIGLGSGTLISAEIKLKDSIGDLTTPILLTIITSGGELLSTVPSDSRVAITGDLTVEVTTGTGGDSVASVKVYGVKY